MKTVAAIEEAAVGAGLPLHDGVLFAATDTEARRVQAIFAETVNRTFGGGFPTTLEPMEAA